MFPFLALEAADNPILEASSRLWREKFRESNIPLLEEGRSSRQWVKIYNRSIQALSRSRKAFREIERGEIHVFSLKELPDINFLYLPGVDYLPFEESLEESGNFHQPYIGLFEEEGNYCLSLARRGRQETFHLSTEDLFFILFNLAFYEKL